MGIRRQNEIDDLLNAAEERGAWLYTKDKAQASALKRRCKAGDVKEVAVGCFARTSTWQKMKLLPRYMFLLRAVSEALPDCVFCRESAAALYGLEVSKANMRRVHICTSRKAHTESSRLVTRHLVENDDAEEIGGLRATSIARTAFDCMRAESFCSGLAIADSALRSGRIPREELERYIVAHPHYPGICTARKTIAYADPRSENGGESFARGTMIELGYMIPELQYPLHDDLSGDDYRADYLWRIPAGNGKVTRVVGELDGAIKYDDPDYMSGRSLAEVVQDERHRESRVSLSVSKICRFSLSTVYDRQAFSRLLDAYGIPRVS